jgi:hypothetical protein
MSLQDNEDEMSLQGEEHHDDNQEQEEDDSKTLNDYVSSYVFDSIASSLK